jgi:hypothetical protein
MASAFSRKAPTKSYKGGQKAIKYGQASLHGQSFSEVCGFAKSSKEEVAREYFEAYKRRVDDLDEEDKRKCGVLDTVTLEDFRWYMLRPNMKAGSPTFSPMKAYQKGQHIFTLLRNKAMVAFARVKSAGGINPSGHQLEDSLNKVLQEYWTLFEQHGGPQHVDSEDEEDETVAAVVAVLTHSVFPPVFPDLLCAPAGRQAGDYRQG